MTTEKTLLTCIPRCLLTNLFIETYRLPVGSFSTGGSTATLEEPEPPPIADTPDPLAPRAPLARGKVGGRRGLDSDVPGSLVDEVKNSDRASLCVTFDGFDQLPTLDEESAATLAAALNGRLGSVFAMIER